LLGLHLHTMVPHTQKLLILTTRLKITRILTALARATIVLKVCRALATMTFFVLSPEILKWPVNSSASVGVYLVEGADKFAYIVCYRRRSTMRLQQPSSAINSSGKKIKEEI